MERKPEYRDLLYAGAIGLGLMVIVLAIISAVGHLVVAIIK